MAESWHPWKWDARVGRHGSLRATRSAVGGTEFVPALAYAGLVLGTDFVNRFSWSPSRERLFGTCLRAYWWRYYAHWDGWSWDAPPLARVAYRLGKMDTLATWAGTIVHDLIEEAIKALRDRNTTIDGEALRLEGRKRLRIGWVESRDGAWVHRPKQKLLLHEHYYGSSEDRNRERTDWAANRVYTSLKHFVEGPFPSLLARVPAANYRSIEDLASIEIAGATVYVKPDLAFVHPDNGQLWLVDWKTGRPSEKDAFQVATYALFAEQSWGVNPESIVGVLAYLSSGETRELRVDGEALGEAKSRIQGSIERMRSLLVVPEDNEGVIEDFPPTENVDACTRCSFLQLCYGDQEVPGAALAGDPSESLPPPLERPRSIA